MPTQGPGKRPAVFSHDKLIWELCDDALEAHRIQNGALSQPRPLVSIALDLLTAAVICGSSRGRKGVLSRGPMQEAP